jgi:hydrogenase nickel incorporation protein HypB
MCTQCGCATESNQSAVSVIDIDVSLHSLNEKHAEENRRWFGEHNIKCLNIIGSPGTGKTSLLEASLPLIANELSIAVIEGDLASEIDASRIAKTGIPVQQINTGLGCHLESQDVLAAAKNQEYSDIDLLIVENVGNLVCPAQAEIGEDKKIVMLSVAEGDDKPAKYPETFAAADVIVVSKMDLMPYVDFDLTRFSDDVARLNAAATIIYLSSKTGSGLPAWTAWLQSQVNQAEVSI